MKGLLFTYVLTYGGSLAAILNPFAGLLVYVCFAIVRPEDMWYWSVPAGNYSRIVAIAMLIGWAIRGFGNWKLGRSRGVVFALIGYLIWSALSATASEFQDDAWHYVEELAKVVLPFLVGITSIDSIAKFKQLAWVIVGSQGYVAFQLNLDYYEGFNRVQILGFGNMDNNSVSIGMVACMGMAFFLGFSATKWWHKLLAFVCAGLMGHVVLFSFSRGGMVAMLITAITIAVLIPKRPKHVALMCVALLLGLRLAGPEVQARFMTSFADAEQRDSSAQSRVDMWKVCWQMMLDHPVLGIGPDHFPLVSDQYGFLKGKEAHSLWLQVGSELGFPGVGFLIIFYVLCVMRLWQVMRRTAPTADPWFAESARMVIASIVGFAAAAQFVSLEGLEIPYYIVLVGAGTLKQSTSAVESFARRSLPATFVPAQAY